MSLRSCRQYHKTTFENYSEIVDWLNRWEFAIDPRFVHILPILGVVDQTYVVIYKAGEWIGPDRYPTDQEKKEALYI